MSKRSDDTPEAGAPSPASGGRERVPGSYYYDDGTGYEPYVADEDEETEKEATEDAEADNADRSLAGELRGILSLVARSGKASICRRWDERMPSTENQIDNFHRSPNLRFTA